MYHSARGLHESVEQYRTPCRKHKGAGALKRHVPGQTLQATVVLLDHRIHLPIAPAHRRPQQERSSRDAPNGAQQKHCDPASAKLVDLADEVGHFGEHSLRVRVRAKGRGVKREEIVEHIVRAGLKEED